MADKINFSQSAIVALIFNIFAIVAMSGSIWEFKSSSTSRMDRIEKNINTIMIHLIKDSEK